MVVGSNNQMYLMYLKVNIHFAYMTWKGEHLELLMSYPVQLNEDILVSIDFSFHDILNSRFDNMFHFFF